MYKGGGYAWKDPEMRYHAALTSPLPKKCAGALQRLFHISLRPPYEFSPLYLHSNIIPNNKTFSIWCASTTRHRHELAAAFAPTTREPS